MNITDAYLEVLEQTALNENLLRKAAAATLLAGASVSLMHHLPTSQKPTPQIVTQTVDAYKESLLKTVKSKFHKIDDNKANHIVDMAIKHSHPTFPKAHHILGVVGIESSFNEAAKSNLKKDPAVGLMQIRPKVWGIHQDELKTIESQIKHGSKILHTYFNKTGSEEAAVKSYNIGITNHLKKKMQPAANRYFQKYQNEVGRYSVD